MQGKDLRAAVKGVWLDGKLPEDSDDVVGINALAGEFSCSVNELKVYLKEFWARGNPPPDGTTPLRRTSTTTPSRNSRRSTSTIRGPSHYPSNFYESQLGNSTRQPSPSQALKRTFSSAMGTGIDPSIPASSRQRLSGTGDSEQVVNMSDSDILRKKIEDLEKQLQAANTATATCESRRVTEKDELERLKEEIERLEEDREADRRELDLQKRKAEKAEDQRQDAWNELDDLQSKVNGLEADKRRRIFEVTEFTRSNRELRAELRDTKKALEACLDSSKDVNDGLKMAFDNLKERFLLLASKRDGLCEEERGALEDSHYEHLRDLKYKCESSKRKHLARIDSLAMDISLLSDTNDELVEERDQLSAQLKAAAARCPDCGRRKAEIKRLQQELEAVSEALVVCEKGRKKKGVQRRAPGDGKAPERKPPGPFREQERLMTEASGITTLPVSKDKISLAKSFPTGRDGRIITRDRSYVHKPRPRKSKKKVDQNTGINGGDANQQGRQDTEDS